MGAQTLDPDAAVVEAAALRLPRAERASLAARLLSSLEDRDEIEAAWAEEIERRVRQVDSGEVQLLDGEEVMAELRTLLR